MGNVAAIADEFDRIVDQAIDFLVAGNVKLGCDGIVELAQVMKTAGIERQSFLDLAKYIENTACERIGGLNGQDLKFAISNELCERKFIVRV